MRPAPRPRALLRLGALLAPAHPAPEATNRRVLCGIDLSTRDVGAAVTECAAAIMTGAVWGRDVALPLIAHLAVSGTAGGVLRQSVTIAALAAAGLLIAPVLLYFALPND